MTNQRIVKAGFELGLPFPTTDIPTFTLLFGCFPFLALLVS